MCSAVQSCGAPIAPLASLVDCVSLVAAVVNRSLSLVDCWFVRAKFLNGVQDHCCRLTFFLVNTPQRVSY